MLAIDLVQLTRLELLATSLQQYMPMAVVSRPHTIIVRDRDSLT